MFSCILLEWVLHSCFLVPSSPPQDAALNGLPLEPRADNQDSRRPWSGSSSGRSPPPRQPHSKPQIKRRIVPISSSSCRSPPHGGGRTVAGKHSNPRTIARIDAWDSHPPSKTDASFCCTSSRFIESTQSGFPSNVSCSHAPCSAPCANAPQPAPKAGPQSSPPKMMCTSPDPCRQSCFDAPGRSPTTTRTSSPEKTSARKTTPHTRHLPHAARYSPIIRQSATSDNCQ